MRALAVLLLLLTPLAALAAAPQIAANGRLVPQSVVVEPTEGDLVVRVGPFLEALGAQVRISDRGLEARWPALILTLQEGSATYNLNGQTGHLSQPVGRLDQDLLAPAGELTRALGGRVNRASWGLELWTPGLASAAETPPGGGPAAPSPWPQNAPPGLQMMLEQGPLRSQDPGSPPSGGMPPTGAPGSETQTGAGGPYTSPYQRPQISGSAPGEEQDFSALPASQRPDPEVSYLQASKVLTFHLYEYKVVARVKNAGPQPLTRPFLVQFLARGSTDSSFEVLESFLVKGLAPGEEVELTKEASGHNFLSLQGLRVLFKVQLLYPAAQQASAGNDSREQWVHW